MPQKLNIEMYYQTGFCFFELMIVFAIVLIFFNFAIGNSNAKLQQEKQAIFRRQLYSMFEQAYQQSQLRKHAVVICASDDLKHCGNNWLAGILIFMQHSQVIIGAIRPNLHEGIVRWRGFSVKDSGLVFSLNKRMQNNNALFWYCPSGSSLATWAIALNKMGHKRLIFPNKDGYIIDNLHRQILTCKN